MFCGETMPVWLKGVTVDAPGLVTLTFWNWPAVMTAGETITEVVPEVATVTSA